MNSAAVGTGAMLCRPATEVMANEVELESGYLKEGEGPFQYGLGDRVSQRD